jgi:hypothetical protein
MRLSSSLTQESAMMTSEGRQKAKGEGGCGENDDVLVAKVNKAERGSICSRSVRSEWYCEWDALPDSRGCFVDVEGL